MKCDKADYCLIKYYIFHKMKTTKIETKKKKKEKRDRKATNMENW